MKRALGMSLILLLQWVGSSRAAQIDHYGYPIPNTPYDQKSALTDVLAGPYRDPAYPSAGSIDQIFRQARRFSYVTDKRGDDWQSPQTTEERRAGDCEDIALWLYAQLRSEGYKNLILVVGKYRSGDTRCHVWLMHVDKNGDVLILDPAIQKRIWPLNAFGQEFYQPIFLFDGSHRYKSSLGDIGIPREKIKSLR